MPFPAILAASCMPSLPSTRAEAKAAGIVRYFTGVPCCRGHVAARYVNGYNCVVCTSERNAQAWQDKELQQAKREAKRIRLGLPPRPTPAQRAAAQRERNRINNQAWRARKRAEREVAP